MFTYKILCDLSICHREMDIRKRYEQSNTHAEKGFGMNFVEQTLTLAQLRDLENVTKPRYEVIKTDNRLLKMAELTNKCNEVDWSFFPIHKVSNYSKYPRQNLPNTEKLWKKQLIIPK